MDDTRTCLLLRTNRFSAKEEAFLSTLQVETGFSVAVVADETARPIDCGAFAKISVTRPGAAQLGLYCPRDFTWRCGDYGLYLARQAMPVVTHFWQIEPDVRCSFRSWHDLFRTFDAGSDVDLIGFDLRPSEPAHWWYPSMLQRTQEVYRCLFGLTRFSARAIDHCYAERRRDFYNVWARVMWPNDETFTATILRSAGMRVRDANTFGRVVYTRDSFGYSTVFRGEEFAESAEPEMVYHPVLWGEDYERRVARLHSSPKFEHMRRRVVKAAMRGRYQEPLGSSRTTHASRPESSIYGEAITKHDVAGAETRTLDEAAKRT